MTYKLILLGLMLLAKSGCIETTEDDPSFSLRANKQNDIYTAGNDKCRSNHACGYDQGRKYRWCYTDYRNNWSYCCSGSCQYDLLKILTCQTGNQIHDCGNPGMQTALGKTCRSSHPCGLHEYGYYWCYVDDSNNWDYCCHPKTKCSKIGGLSNVCNISPMKDAFVYGHLANCIPQE